MALSFRTALADIEAAIVRTLRLALLERQVVADVDALRAFAVLGESGLPVVKEGAPIFMTATGLNWQWRRSSVADDNGFSVIRPTAIATSDPGRWLSTTSTAPTGYLKAVNYWQGETKKSEFQARILAERPSLAVVWESGDNVPRSTVPGAIYDYPCNFSVWCIDENLRPDYEVMQGSGYAADAAHPGVIAMLGDVKKALADANKQHRDVLGLGGGAKVIALGAEDMEDADLAERVMVVSLGVTVLASVENPDNEASEHQSISAVGVQPRLTELHEATSFDPGNYVVSGLRVTPQASLTATPSAGAVVLGGARLAVTPSAHSFGASVDTYLDVTAAAGETGAIAYVAVANDAAAPDVTSGALRVARIKTDSLGIVAYEPIAPTSDDFGDAFEVLP